MGDPPITSSFQSLQPSYLLGQPGVETCLLNGDGDIETPPTAQNTFNYPTGLSSDGTRLIVADNGNHRVLIWNTFPTQNQQNADRVLGQQDFASNTPQTLSDRALNYPAAVELFAGKLYVADKDHNRVLIWNTLPTSSYAAADVVLGQANFSSSGYSVSENSTPAPNAVRVCGNHLYVSQEGRISIFEGRN
jgi:hypothetical protein